MARIILVALVWSAVQGEEYGGGGMPQYGGVAADYAEPAAAVASADYTGHSPDAPAPLDYKYIEDPLGNREKFHKDVDGINEWEQRPKERRSRHDKDELDMVDSETAVPKHKPSRRTRHRSRLKSEKFREPRRRRNRTNRGNEDNADVGREYLRNNDYRDEMKSKVLDEEHIPIKETTERIVRRKARDRHFAPPAKSIDLESEDEIIGPGRKLPAKGISMESDDEILGPVRKMKDDDDKSESEYNINQNRRHGYGRPPGPPLFDPDDDDDIDSDIDLRKKSSGKRKFNKNYPDYNNYYDMKRVYNIKNRLPMLLRRTTTRIPSLEEDNTSEFLNMLWTARRAASPCTIALQTTTSTTTTTTTTTTTISPVVIPKTPSSTTQAPSSTASPEFSDFPTTKEIRELSLAEKSRLSILKKAHRKESDKPAPSTKPPVLLQVTSRMPTVVMVEPPPGPDPWMRAKEISNDSPERLEQVKRLMRQKLVADAKNIKDLTDNWDEMVCDYIDTSLLDSQACNCKIESWLLIICYAISKNV